MVHIPAIIEVIDLHCDTLTRCADHGLDLSDNSLHLSLNKLPKDIRLCQCMAVFIPDTLRGAEAESYFNCVYGYFLSQMKKYEAETSWITDISEIGKGFPDKAGKRFAAVLTVEGGAVLSGKLQNIKRLYDLGVRMMTLTWNAENEICGGVDTALGFTDFGRKTVKEMERLGMAVDVSHLSDKGFYELCGFASKPFVASHSNSRKICNHRRNLTDEMFAEIVKRGGLVGLNYYENFIKEDGESISVDDLLRHVHHFLELGGEDTLALGSDFDGADIPEYINGVNKLDFLINSIKRSGIPEAVTEKIIYKNAAKYFTKIAGGKTDDI